MDGRPVRANRGVRTTPITQEEQQKQMNFYNEMFGNIEQSDEEDSEVQLEDVFHSMTRKEKANANCQNYPYSRGCHYFYNLLTYPRIDNSSYVQDIYPYGTYNDSKVKQLYGLEVFNRKYIGLPKRQQSQDANDKNVCHEYLFKNEDAKWKLDQQLYELKYIQKHPQILQGTACKNYHFLKRDIELFPLYAPQTSMQDKILLLKSKIQFLEHRKQKLQQEFFTEDDIFYHSSLNQKFFNQKEEQEAAFNIQNIIVEAICMSEINDQIFVEGAEEDTAKIGVLFSIFSTLDIDQVHPAYPVEFEQYLNVGRTQQQIPPSFIMSFINKQHLNWVGQVLSIRSLQTQGDTVFSQLKKIWSKLFNQQLVYIQQYTPIQKQQYIEAIKTVAISFKQQNQKSQYVLPTLPKPSTTNYDFYFQQNQQTNQLSAKEYIILYFIYYLYERVGIMNLDYRLVGNVLFRKYQYKLCEKIGSVVANVQLTIKKCIQIVMENLVETQVPIDIHSEYLPENSTMMIWIINKEGFEGLVQEQGEQELGQQDGNDDGEDQQQDQQQDEQQNDEDGQNEQQGSDNDSNHDIDEYEKPKKKFRLQ